MSAYNLSLLFLIPFVVFILVPKLPPLFRYLQTCLHKKKD